MFSKKITSLFILVSGKKVNNHICTFFRLKPVNLVMTAGFSQTTTFCHWIFLFSHIKASDANIGNIANFVFCENPEDICLKSCRQCFDEINRTPRLPTL